MSTSTHRATRCRMLMLIDRLRALFASDSRGPQTIDGIYGWHVRATGVDNPVPPNSPSGATLPTALKRSPEHGKTVWTISELERTRTNS